MLRYLISMTYFYKYFNQFSNVLECYEETTVRRPAAATHTHTPSCKVCPLSAISSRSFEILILDI